MNTIQFQPGEVVFEENSQSDCAYLIEKGKFEVSRMCNGQKKFIGILKEKEIFGEMGLIDDKPRSATVTAIENSKVSVISKDCFRSLERVNPESLMPLLRVLSGRIRETYKLSNHNNASV